MVDVSRCNLSGHCTMVETHCDLSRPKPVKRNVKASDDGVNAVRANVKAVNATIYSTMVDVNRCNLRRLLHHGRRSYFTSSFNRLRVMYVWWPRKTTKPK